MTRITSSDQILLLLKNHLQRTEKLSRPRSAPKAARKGALDRARSIASSEQASEEDIKRVLIAGILEQEFGAGLTGDPRFQEMVRDVVRVISSDDHCRAVFDNAIAQLKLDGTGR